MTTVKIDFSLYETMPEQICEIELWHNYLENEIEFSLEIDDAYDVSWENDYHTYSYWGKDGNIIKLKNAEKDCVSVVYDDTLGLRVNRKDDKYSEICKVIAVDRENVIEKDIFYLFCSGEEFQKGKLLMSKEEVKQYLTDNQQDVEDGMKRINEMVFTNDLIDTYFDAKGLAIELSDEKYWEWYGLEEALNEFKVRYLQSCSVHSYEDTNDYNRFMWISSNIDSLREDGGLEDYRELKSIPIAIYREDSGEYAFKVKFKKFM